MGDDVYREDPTLRALEERVAELFGHEDALFVPSGTMGNQIGLRLVCQPGEEILGDADCHVLTYELGAAAAIFGLSSRTVVSDGGRLDADRLIEQVRPRGDWHVTPTAAIAVENTHNRGGGIVQPLDELQKLWDWSREAGRRRPPRRRADLQRRRRHRQGPRHLRPARRHRVGLPVQGPGRAGRLGAGGLRRPDRRRPAVAQAAGRRDAPGRHPRRRRPVRPRPPPRAAGRRPRERPAAGRAARASTRRRSRRTSWSWTA